MWSENVEQFKTGADTMVYSYAEQPFHESGLLRTTTIEDYGRLTDVLASLIHVDGYPQLPLSPLSLQCIYTLQYGQVLVVPAPLSFTTNLLLRQMKSCCSSAMS
jgi:hypothetical protein